MKITETERLQIQSDARKIMRIIVACLFLIVAVFLCSCSTRKKEITKNDETQKETTVIKKDSTNTIKKDSLVTKKDGTKETVIETEIDFNGGKDLVIENENGKTIISGSGNVKIKRFDKFKNGNSTETFQINKTSLNQSKTVKESVKETKTNTINKNVVKKGFQFMVYIWFFLLILIIIIIYLAYKRIKI